MSYQFEKMLQKVAHRHSFSTVFDDFLQMSICALAHQTMEERYLEVAKRYNKSDLELIGHAFGQMFLDYEKVITPDGSWKDPLGQIYMDNISKSQAGNMGQFFTPEEVCMMMAIMTTEGPVEKDISALDPSSGSSRCLIAHCRVHPQNRFNTFYVACDLDYTCVMMSVINFFMFGMKGVVIHMNSLTMEFYGGYRVYLAETGLMIRYLNKEQCRHFMLSHKQEPVVQTIPTPLEEDWIVVSRPIDQSTMSSHNVEIRNSIQGSLFEDW